MIIKLKCGRCGTIHVVSGRHIPQNGVKMLRCDGCDNHFLIEKDCSVKAKYESSRKVCPNCAKDVALEAMQCRYCEYFFSKDDRVKNKRIQRHQYGTSSSFEQRKKRRRLIVVALFLMVSAVAYFVSGGWKGPVGRMVRSLAPGMEIGGISIVEPSYMLKLASGGRMYVISYQEKGKFLEVEDQRGSVFSIAREEVVEILPVE